MKKHRRLIPTSLSIIQDYKSDQSVNFFTNYISQDKSLFVSRIGGSDYDAVNQYFNDPSLINDDRWYTEHLTRVKSHNGYFDFTNKKENFEEYLKSMIEFYRDADIHTYAGSNMINQLNSGQCNLDRYDFLDLIASNKTLLHYGFIEFMNPFLKSFQTWGNNKRILIISPLSESINRQVENLDNLYLDYKFPDCVFLTYNTSITYSDADDSKESLNIQSDHWHEEAERMCEDIKSIDFDIALLSCASYSMYLGHYIKNNLGKKSIYLGGILNMFFNIYGSRYIQPAYQEIYKDVGLNPSALIEPLENARVENIKSGRLKTNESLKAYFGRKQNV